MNTIIHWLVIDTSLLLLQYSTLCVDNVCIEVMSLHITRSTLDRCHSNLNTLAQTIEKWVTMDISYHGYSSLTVQSNTKPNSYNQNIVI